MRPLFKSPLLSRLLITGYMQISNFVASAAMGLWFTSLSNQISQASLKSGTLCDILRHKNSNNNETTALNLTIIDDTCSDIISEKAFKDTLLTGVYYIIVLVLIAAFIKAVGRGHLQMITFFGSSLAGYLTLWLTNPNVAIVFLSLLLVLSGCTISLVSGSAVLLFPTSVRTTAISLILMAGRLATTIGTSIIGATIQSHCEVTLFTVTSIVLGELQKFTR